MMTDNLLRNVATAVVSALLLVLTSTGAISFLNAAGVGAALSAFLSIFVSTILVFIFAFLIITSVE